MSKYSNPDYTEDKLRDMWGDKYEGNLKKVRTFLEAHATPETKQKVNEGLGASPSFAQNALSLARQTEAKSFEIMEGDAAGLYPNEAKGDLQRHFDDLPAQLDLLVRDNEAKMFGGHLDIDGKDGRPLPAAEADAVHGLTPEFTKE